MKNLFLILFILFVSVFLTAPETFSQTTVNMKGLTYNVIKADSVETGEIDTSSVFVIDHTYSKLFNFIIVDSVSASDSLCILTQASLNKTDWYTYNYSGEFENTDTLISEASALDIYTKVPRYLRWIYTPKGTGVYIYYRHYAILKQN